MAVPTACQGIAGRIAGIDRGPGKPGCCHAGIRGRRARAGHKRPLAVVSGSLPVARRARLTVSLSSRAKKVARVRPGPGPTWGRRRWRLLCVVRVCACVCPWFSRESARTGLPPPSGSSSRRRAAVFWSPQRPSNVLLPFRGTEGDGSGVPNEGMARFAGIGLTSSGAGFIKSHAIVTRVHA